MNKLIYLLFITTLMSCSNSTFFTRAEKGDFVQLETSKGNITLHLYDDTPLHKANFLKLVENDFYDGIIFHRVINDFMIQAGDPDSKNPLPNETYGSGGPGYKVPAEILPHHIHKKGALAAARDNNPEKASSGSQFYIVEGESRTEGFLEMMENRNKNSYTEKQKEIYKTMGGVPFLDTQYTVFGEVVEGIEIVELISDLKTDRRDRPKEDVIIKSAKKVKFKKKK